MNYDEARKIYDVRSSPSYALSVGVLVFGRRIRAVLDSAADITVMNESLVRDAEIPHQCGPIAVERCI